MVAGVPEPWGAAPGHRVRLFECPALLVALRGARGRGDWALQMPWACTETRNGTVPTTATHFLVSKHSRGLTAAPPLTAALCSGGLRRASRDIHLVVKYMTGGGHDEWCGGVIVWWYAGTLCVEVAWGCVGAVCVVAASARRVWNSGVVEA